MTKRLMSMATTSLTENWPVEEAVLGAICLKGEIPAGCDLEPSHFTAPDNKRVYEVMQGLNHIDALTLANKLQRAYPRNMGWDSVTQGLAASVPNVGNFWEYVRILKECRTWRLRQSAAVRMLEAAEKGDEDCWQRGVNWMTGTPNNVIPIRKAAS